MRAATYERYGPPDVLGIRDVATPRERPDEVLVRVVASTVCAADWRFRKADPAAVRVLNGLVRPRRRRILGMEFSGVVERAGIGVTRFQPGDEVFGSTLFAFAAHAEFLVIPERGFITAKPRNMSHDEAAAVPFGGTTALYFLRAAGIQAGQRVLVNGASGSVGVFAVQLAKRLGSHVTGVCSTRNLDLVRSLGADAVVDYTAEDLDKIDGSFDIVCDTVGTFRLVRSLSMLKRGGAYVLIGAPPLTQLIGDVARATPALVTRRIRLITGVTRGRLADLEYLKGEIEEGLLRTIIDKRYALAEIADAHRHAESGHKRGHVVVAIGTSP